MNEVKRLLRKSRSTIYRYVDQGLIRRSKMVESGIYDYNDEDVYTLLNKDVPRKTYIYARVSTHKQKKSLSQQIDQLKQWILMNGHVVHGIYADIASGISFEQRKDFFTMLEDILKYQVERVIVTHKDRLSRIGFGLFKFLFEKYGTEIVVISEVGNPKIDAEEIFEEIVAMLHCYSMKLYSKRRKTKKKMEVIIDIDKR